MRTPGEFPEFAAENRQPAPSATAGPHPRFDGLYVAVEPDDVAGKERRARKEPGFCAYIRFTAPDLVSTVTSLVGAVEQIARWFGPEHTGCSQGTYELDGTSISFAATSRSGTVLYSGTLSPDASTLLLDTHSLINGRRAHVELRFTPASFPDRLKA
ncbi:hypothetical protein [Embleya sp. NPDC020886]|uniref:hypothetical protein n=1 Tax=Embleya sp. NPDC020886 TaxID=3363980 RepID=UPI0037BD305A